MNHGCGLDSFKTIGALLVAVGMPALCCACATCSYASAGKSIKK